MAAAKVDLNINQGETWELQMEFWQNNDETLPIDISMWVFKGAMNFGSLCVPMSFNSIDNTVAARIEADQLSDLPLTGTYAIEASNGFDTTRVLQGNIQVDKGSVC